MEGKTCKNGWGTIGEEGPLNRSPENPTVEAKKMRIPVLPDIPGTTGHSLGIPRCAPHLEERLIGGVVDLDLLFQIPQEYARIIGGIERKQA